jgi:uncharacterized protein YlxW (UPF0749 family)
MDIKQIVDSTLVAPMREQSMQYRIETLQSLVDRKQNEIQRLNNLLDSYRSDNADHERLIGKLRDLMRADEYDDAYDLVRNEFDAIHGP